MSESKTFSFTLSGDIMYNLGMEKRRPLPLGARAGGFSFSACVALYMVLSLIASGIISLSGISGTDGGKYISYLVSPVAIAVILGLAFGYFRQPVKRVLPLRCRPKYIFIGLLLIFGLLFSLSWVNDYLIQLFELMGYERQGNTLPDIGGWKILPALLVVAVLPAVMEEALFRGLILNNIESDAGSVKSVFIVGLCFSLYHGSVEQTIYQFVCGCLFALLAVRSRSITPTVIIHFINNALIIVLYAVGAVDAETGALTVSLGGEIALYVLSGISLVVAVVWLIMDKTLLSKGEKGGVKSFFVYASAGIAAMIIVWITGLFV